MQYAVKAPTEEWRTYGYIAMVLQTYATINSSKLMTMGPVPQAHLVKNRSIPDFAVFLHQFRTQNHVSSLILSWEAKPLDPGVSWPSCDGPLSLENFWLRVIDLANTSLTEHYDSIEDYARQYFKANPSVDTLFKFFSTGPVFSLFEFRRNRYYTQFELEAKYAKGVDITVWFLHIIQALLKF